jgi:hypothetical protein
MEDQTKPPPQNDETLRGDPDEGEFIPGTNIHFPSSAYRSACDSYPYRISELIFGSLLAAYILGFVSFGIHSDLIGIFQSLFISGTFCYLTAAYYLTYHNSILTMPHLPSEGLRFDFGIAILQAVLFGFSMIFPNAFFLMVAASISVIFWRQTKAYDQLQKLFKDNTQAKPTHISNLDPFPVKFERSLWAINKQEAFHNCFKGWLPVGKGNWACALALLVIGSVQLGAYYWLNAFPKNSGGWQPKAAESLSLIEAIVSGIIFVFVYWRANDVFIERAAHQIGKDQQGRRRLVLDLAASALVQLLESTPSQASKDDTNT